MFFFFFFCYNFLSCQNVSRKRLESDVQKNVSLVHKIFIQESSNTVAQSTVNTLNTDSFFLLIDHSYQNLGLGVNICANDKTVRYIPVMPGTYT